MDIEQKYYDLLYENRQLKKEIEELKMIIKLKDKGKNEIIKYIIENTRRNKCK